MKVSVIIPCTYKHILHISNLIRLFEDQTVLPNEIIIIISGIEMAFNVQQKLFSNKIEIITNVFPEKRFAGENRETGANIASGDILIFQDADDIPHKQRIEVIKKVFLNTKCLHVLHGWETENNKEEIIIDMENIKTYLTKDVFIIEKKNLFKTTFLYSCSYKIIDKIHNGAFSIDKSIIKQICWSNKRKGQDLETNYNIINTFPKKSLVISSNKLYKYRNELSSWN